GKSDDWKAFEEEAWERFILFLLKMAVNRYHSIRLSEGYNAREEAKIRFLIVAGHAKKIKTVARRYLAQEETFVGYDRPFERFEGMLAYLKALHQSGFIVVSTYGFQFPY